MSLLVVSFSALFFIVIILLLKQKGNESDGKAKLIRYIKAEEEVKSAQLEELDQSFYTRMIAPLLSKVTSKVQDSQKKRSANQNVRNEKNQQKIKKTEKLLRMSGTHTSYENYRFGKIAFSTVFSIVFIGLIIVAGLNIGLGMLCIAIGVVLALILPDFILKSRVSTHQAAIKKQLPDVIDLIGVCMEAGLSFDGAIVKISEKMEGPFIDELMTAFKQIQMGIPRAAALNEISECTDINELKTLMSALIQASTLGIPVTNIIQVQSKQIRETRKENAKEKGNKAPIKMSLPTILLIFPALIIVVAGPAIISMTSSFK